MNRYLDAPANARPAHPSVFLILVLPFGVVSGYVTVALGYLFSKAGISVGEVAALVAAGLLPQVFKFLWAPAVDAVLSLKKWYILSCFVSSACIIATGLLPIKESSLPIMTLIVIVANVAVSFVGMVANGLAAHDTPHHLKGRVGGFLQAGNLGGSGIGGGAGLWLAQHFANAWISPVVIGLSCLFCCFGLFFVNEPASTVQTEKITNTLRNLFSDIWGTLKTRLGLMAMILCFLPLGTGAASNLWSAVAGDWHASADTVAFVTGVVSGFITAAGCLLGGWICDRMDRQIAYTIFGLLMAICAVAMAIAPHTEAIYIFWTSLYAFLLGLSYAGFSAFVFDAIGKGAAATKFTVYAALSNAPIYYMTIVDGWAHTRFGPSGMLNVEAAVGVLGVAVFVGLLWFVRRKPAAVIAS